MVTPLRNEGMKFWRYGKKNFSCHTTFAPTARRRLRSFIDCCLRWISTWYCVLLVIKISTVVCYQLCEVIRVFVSLILILTRKHKWLCKSKSPHSKNWNCRCITIWFKAGIYSIKMNVNNSKNKLRVRFH